MEATRIRLAEGVHLTYLPARKFKTSLLSAQFVTPLRRETAGANALLAAVLRRGTVSCPDMGALSAKMDNLYDASIDYTVRKKGENQCVGFVASFIDDRYAPGGERLLEPAAALLGELVCDPVTYHGRFVPEYFESEKTNLLEAIWLLTGGKSFRGGKDAELVRRGETFAVLEAVTQRTRQEDQEPDDPARVRITVGTPDAPRPGRYASVNGAAPKRAAGLAGSFPAVVFDPGHLSLVKGAPEGRRRFLDAALCQLYPGYLATYRRYVRVLQQKNALLRHSATGQERPYAEKRALLEVLNVELAAQGEVLQQRRRDYLALLGPLACANYQELSHGAERMSIRYAAQFAPGGLADLLKQRQNEELRAGQSLCGVHREDLELLLDDQPARVFASQGQQRSVVLSLKMAEAAAAARITGEHPVLLLDDVLSELDEGRKQYLLTRMKEKQTFVTSCDDTAFLKTDGEVYRMNGGVLSRA